MEEIGERRPPFFAFFFWPSGVRAVARDNVNDKERCREADDHPAAIDLAMP